MPRRLNGNAAAFALCERFPVVGSPPCRCDKRHPGNQKQDENHPAKRAFIELAVKHPAQPGPDEPAPAARAGTERTVSKVIRPMPPKATMIIRKLATAVG